jgi:hypothetical protein
MRISVQNIIPEEIMVQGFGATVQETFIETDTYFPSGVSWAAIAAGAVAAAALTLVLVAFGAGLGLSAISPWSNSGVSAGTFKVGTGIYLCIVAVMSSAIGGFLAARLRTKVVGLHSNEVFFRDTAHGFLAWAFATLISATALVSTTSYLASGTLTGVAAGSAQAGASDPAQLYVDKLFRTAAPGQAGASSRNGAEATAEIARLWKADFASNADLSATDRAYVAQLIATHTGMSQADAQKRLDEVVAEAKTDADNARRAAAHLSFWVTAALLFGAFAASLAAAEGGVLRDGIWNGRVLTPRDI